MYPARRATSFMMKLNHYRDAQNSCHVFGSLQFNKGFFFSQSHRTVADITRLRAENPSLSSHFVLLVSHKNPNYDVQSVQSGIGAG